MEKIDIERDFFHTVGFDRAALYPFVSFFIVSHADCDHLTNSEDQWIPSIYLTHRNLKNVHYPITTIPWSGYEISTGKKRIKVVPLMFDKIRGAPNRLHCVWMDVSYYIYKESTIRGLLIGDLDVQDVQYVVKTVIARKVDFVVLPSYGGVIEAHGAEYTTQLSQLIEEAAKELKIEGMTIFARPHPITTEWADINLEIVTPQLCTSKHSTSKSF